MTSAREDQEVAGIRSNNAGNARHDCNPDAAHGQESSATPALDFTKGALVLIMVLYHWLNYFYGPRGDVYRYLRFLTPSFIFITDSWCLVFTLQVWSH